MPKLNCIDRIIDFSSKKDVKKTENPRIKIGPSYINYSVPVRNRSLVKNTGMKQQMNSIVKSCYY